MGVFIPLVKLEVLKDFVYGHVRASSSFWGIIFQAKGKKQLTKIGLDIWAC